jgi:hypothetical protein
MRFVTPVGLATQSHCGLNTTILPVESIPLKPETHQDINTKTICFEGNQNPKTEQVTSSPLCTSSTLIELSEGREDNHVCSNIARNTRAQRQQSHRLRKRGRERIEKQDKQKGVWNTHTHTHTLSLSLSLSLSLCSLCNRAQSS